MSAATVNCCPCPTTENVEIPGSPGADGAAGINAFTTLADSFTIGGSSTIRVVEASWIAYGQILFISDDILLVNVMAFLSAGNVVTVQLQNYPGDSVSGVISAGAKVTPGGRLPVLGTLPSVITDNSGGTASSVITQYVGITTLSFFVNLVDVGAVATAIVTNYIPGYSYKIIRIRPEPEPEHPSASIRPSTVWR